MDARILFFTVFVLACPSLASAYVGPGMAGGAIAAVLGVAASLAMLVVGVVWYPLKRAIRFFRSGNRPAE